MAKKNYNKEEEKPKKHHLRNNQQLDSVTSKKEK